MKLTTVGYVVVLLATLLQPFAALGQGFRPTRPVELVVHTGPGGGSDVLARAIALMVEREQLLPVRLQVVNKPGGNAAVAAAYLRRRRATLHDRSVHRRVADHAAGERRGQGHVARPDADRAARARAGGDRGQGRFAVRTLADFIDAAKKNPGQLKQSGGSNTSRDNVVRQQLQKSTGARWAFISFPGGGERIAALLGGHVR